MGSKLGLSCIRLSIRASRDTVCYVKLPLILIKSTKLLVMTQKDTMMINITTIIIIIMIPFFFAGINSQIYKMLIAVAASDFRL